MPIYMKYGSIKGDVTADGHKDWIELHSAQFGVGRGIGSPTGAAANRESSAPSVSEFVVTKNTDKSSHALFRESLEGEGDTVQIDFCKTDKGKLEVYLTVTMENTLVSGFSMSSGGDKPSESISLNFTKVEYKQIGQDAKGAPTSPNIVTYDLAAAKAK